MKIKLKVRKASLKYKHREESLIPYTSHFSTIKSCFSLNSILLKKKARQFSQVMVYISCCALG